MEQKKGVLLFVEDDPSLGTVVRDYLNLSGFKVDWVDNGKSGWDKFLNNSYDLCIIDVMLPALDGFGLTEMIRSRNSDIPVIFLTAKVSMEDKLKGFKIGADDYIIKPFNIEELVFRIEVFLKRKNQPTPSKATFQIGSYVFDYKNLCLSLSNKKQTLTSMEAELLRIFCIQKGEVIKREYLLNNVWGNDDYITGRSLDVFISRLRKYLKEDPSIDIQNVHAVGYRLNEQ